MVDASYMLLSHAKQTSFGWRRRATKNPGLQWNGVGHLCAYRESAIPKYDSAVRLTKPRSSGSILRYVPQRKVCYSWADARQIECRQSRRRRGGVGKSSAQASDARDASGGQTPAGRAQL